MNKSHTPTEGGTTDIKAGRGAMTSLLPGGGQTPLTLTLHMFNHVSAYSGLFCIYVLFGLSLCACLRFSCDPDRDTAGALFYVFFLVSYWK